MALVITVSKVLRIRGCRGLVRNPVAALSRVGPMASLFVRSLRLSGQFHAGRTCRTSIPDSRHGGTLSGAFCLVNRGPLLR